jgi:surface polysaccharide O-acyltransferase-like enzyme
VAQVSASSLALLKVVAIYSIVSAHVDISEDALGVFYALKIGYYIVGSMGVGLFFIVVGCGLAARPRGLESTLKKLGSFYVLPWIASGSAVYAYIYFRKPELALTWQDFLIGNGSYLYFMPVFCFFLILGSFLRHKLLRFTALLMSLIYSVSGQNIMPFGINEHLNPLLWIPYLVFGYSLEGGFRNSRETFRSVEFLLIAIFAFFSVFFADDNFVSRGGLNYQSAALIFLVCSFGAIVAYSSPAAHLPSIDRLSENTLFVYLWHMPFIGLLNFIANQYATSLHLISPAIVLLCLMLSLRIAHRLSRGKLILRFAGARSQ